MTRVDDGVGLLPRDQCMHDRSRIGRSAHVRYVFDVRRFSLTLESVRLQFDLFLWMLYVFNENQINKCFSISLQIFNVNCKSPVTLKTRNYRIRTTLQ